MTINEVKDKVQREALNKWYKKGCRGTIEAVTAFGKTRCGIIALDYFYKKGQRKFKIIVPTVEILKNWKEEIIKWKVEYLLEVTEIECINTACKKENEVYDMLIADEVHNYLAGIEFSKVFTSNTFNKILGLSASLDPMQVLRLSSIAPIVYTLSLQKASELNLIPEFHIFNVPVNLTEEELSEYTTLSNKIEEYYLKTGRQNWKLIGERTSLLYHAENKIPLIREITDFFVGKRGIVFSMTTEDVNNNKQLLGDICIPHHSKISLKKRREYLTEFNTNPNLKVIVSAKTLDEGVTIPLLEYGIIKSGSSKKRQSIQRLGRLLRDDIFKKVAFIVRLYCVNTQEEKWVKSSQFNLKTTNTNGIEDLKSRIKEIQDRKIGN